MGTENVKASTDAEIRELIKRVASRVRVTKVVATRSIKSKNGDHFVAFAAGWDSVQDDASGPGADVELVLSAQDVATNGFTLREAMVAQLLVAMKANLAVYQNAHAAGSVSAATYEQAVMAIKNNFSLAVRQVAVEALPKE